MDARRVALLVVGGVLLAVAGLVALGGVADDLPIVALIAAIVGVLALTVGLLARDDPGDTHETRVAEPEQRRRRVVTVAVGLGLMGIVALVVALTIPVGEARGHAFGHWMTGTLALFLFALLGLLWHPGSGTTAAAVRIAILAVLAVSAFGAFLESLGGSGYDAANAEPRIDTLAALHGIALPIAASGLPAIPLGLIVAAVVAVMWVLRRRREHA